MSGLSIAWGLVAILALALFFLWRRADRRGRELTRTELVLKNTEAKLEAKNEQDKKDAELRVLDGDDVADDIVRDAIKAENDNNG